MREILFRAKTEDDIWVEGSLHIEYGETTKDGKREIDYRILGMRGEHRYIKPETVGQYTGINVGNEKLFEGDIVECHEDYDDSWGFSKTSVVRAVVVWDEENFCWAFEIEKKYRQPFNDWTWNNSFINGNIHDNPELLKGGVEE